VSLTVGGLSTPGAGKLVLPAETVTFTAATTTGGGNFSYKTSPASVTLSSGTGLTHVGNLSIAGTVSFAGNLTVNGDASFGTTTDATASNGATLTFNGATATIGAYTAKAEDNPTTFAGSAPLTITTLTDASAASKVIFNGPTTITNAVTTDTGGLTIAGEGAVTLTAAPVLTNGLIVTNMTGVSMPSATIPVNMSIDASEGKVIFGTTTNSTTLTNATLTSGANGQASVAANGVITLAYNTSVANSASLKLASGGSITVAGDSAKVELPHTVFGAGTYTAKGEVTITAGDSDPGDTIVTAAGAGNGLILGSATTALSLLTQGTAATYTFTAADSKKIVLGNGATAITVGNGATQHASNVSASDKASIVLGTGGNATDAIKLGHAAILELKSGAKIGVFTNNPVDVADGSGSSAQSGSIGTAVVAGSTATTHKFAQTGGTYTAGADITLTGAAGGTSAITAGAAIVQGSIGS
jgi:filamentous hemagglutinin